MAAPARSIVRSALAALIAATVVIQPGVAAAQSQEPETLIRDTEIEDILHKDADPIFRAAGIDPKGVHVIIIGSKDLNAFAGPGVMAVFTGLILQTKNPN